MRVRELPSGEWSKLTEQDAAFLRTMRPEDVAMFVTEDDSGKILAHMAVFRAPHFESFWIDPENYGNPGVTRGLLKAAGDKAREWNPAWVMANAAPGPMTDTLERLGGQWLPVHTYIVALEDQWPRFRREALGAHSEGTTSLRRRSEATQEEVLCRPS